MKKIILFLLIFISFASCSNDAEEKVQKNYSTEILWSGSIIWENILVWYTQGIQQVMLATKSPGRIIYLEKNNGESVKAWELLASLDSAEAKAGYVTAENIEKNLSLLKKQTSAVLDRQIQAMEKKINSIKAWVSGTQTGLEDTKNMSQKQIHTAQVALETAELNLEETQKTLKIQKENILSGAKTALVGFIILDENIVNFSDILLGVSEKHKRKNDNFEDYLWARNKAQYKDTQNYFREVQGSFQKFKDYYEQNIENKNPSEAVLLEWLTLAEALAEEEKILLKKIFTSLDNSLENVYFTQKTIDGYKKQVSDLWIQLEQSLLSMSGDTPLWIKWSIQNLKSFESESKKWISLLKKQVELARKSLESSKAQTQGEINSVSTQAHVAQLGLEEALAWLSALKAQKQASLSEIESKIAEVSGSKSQAWVMIQNGKIIAPFSGIITQKMAEQWQVINAGTPLYELADNSRLKVSVFVPQRIYENIKVWDSLSVNIAELWKNTLWKINRINSSLHPITKRYEVEVIIENPDKSLPIGIMVELIFQKDSKKEISKNKGETHSVRVPNSSIISRFMIPWVYLVKDHTAYFKNIKILEMGEEYSEVLWLSLGDKIITKWKENIYDREILNY